MFDAGYYWLVLVMMVDATATTNITTTTTAAVDGRVLRPLLLHQRYAHGSNQAIYASSPGHALTGDRWGVVLWAKVPRYIV